MTHKEIVSNIVNGGNMKPNPIMFVWNNCEQCFDCGHCEGTKTIYKAGKWWKHPVCDMDGGIIMTEVFYSNCPRKIPRK